MGTITGKVTINGVAYTPSAAVTILSDAGFTGAPGVIAFDSLTGATDNDRIVSLNAWTAQFGAGAPRPAVVFAPRVHKFSTPIQLRSGMALVGGKGVAAREFGTGTVLSWQGGPGTSMWAYPGSQDGQGYPSDGSPRDISLYFLEFHGGSSTHWLPKFDTGGGQYQGHTLWNTHIHGCGWMGFSTVWWGWGNGCTIDGPTHLQAIGDTAFNVGGSECVFFGDAYSFQDSGLQSWTTGGKPFFRSYMSKSTIGAMMFSARGNSFQLSIEGGDNLVVRGTAFDAPYSAPTAGASVKISGGRNIVLDGLSFKGQMNAPGSANGGTAGNAGLVHITGGTQILVTDCAFRRDGTTAPASTPLVFTGPNVGAGQVKVGLTACDGYAGTLRQSVAGQIVTTDPALSVIT